MNTRRKNLFWIVVIGLALAFVTGLVTAQPQAQLTSVEQTQTRIAAGTATPSPLPPAPTESPVPPTPTASATPLPGQEALIQPYTLTDLYGQPSVVYSDLAGDLYACQTPAQTVSESPSDITRIEVYLVPNNFVSASGYIVAVYTAVPFGELLNEYSAAMLFRSATVGGQTEHRINEIHEGQPRIGVVNNNNQLVEGTTQLASVSPDGAAAVFNVPDTVSQFQITSYYSAQAGLPTTCDVAPNNGLYNLPANWIGAVQISDESSLLTTGIDEVNDTVVCGVGGSVDAAQIDITDVKISPAPANAPFPDGFVIGVRTRNPPVVGDFNESVFLNLSRGGDTDEFWLMGNVTGRFSTRVQDSNNVPINQPRRWGDYSGMSVDPAEDNYWYFNVPADVTAIQARTSLTVEQGGQQVCDQYPSDGSWIDLPPVWTTSIAAENLVTIFDDPAGDTVDAATGASVNAPDADITSIGVFDPGDGSPSILAVPHTALDASFNRNITATFLSGSGEWYRVTLEQSGGRTTVDTTDSNGATLYAPDRVAGFFDAADFIGAFSPAETTVNNWAAAWSFGLFPDDTTQVTITTQVTTADGQTVRDDTAAINLPDRSIVVTESNATQVTICPQGSTTPRIYIGDDRPHRIISREGHRYIASVGGLSDPEQGNLITNPWILTSECDDPQFAAPTSPPTVEDVYGAAVLAATDPTGDSYDCQNPAATVGSNPADIVDVSAHAVPDNVLPIGAYQWRVTAFRTTLQPTTPDSTVPAGNYVWKVRSFQPAGEIFNTAYSAAFVVNAVTAGGERANRRIQIHEGQTSSGALGDNNDLIAGTSDLVGFDADGSAVVVLPGDTTQVKVTSYFSAGAGQPTLCDTTETINFAGLFSGGTLGDFYDSLGIVTCPPLDGIFDLDMPIDQQSGDALRLGLLLFTPRQSDSSRYLVLTDPSRPYHPLFNPVQLRDSCIEPYSVDSPLADRGLFEAVDALGITLCSPLTVATDGDAAWEALMVMMGSETGTVEVRGTHLELRDPSQPYDADNNPIEWKNGCTEGIPQG